MIFPIATKAGGICSETPPFSNVCWTPSKPPPGPNNPTAPMPYPNIAMLQQANAAQCSRKVRIQGRKVILKNTIIPTSTGDEPGTGGGILSGVNKGKTRFMRWSQKVNVEGKPVVFQTCNTTQNGGGPKGSPPNAAGLVVTVTQQIAKVSF